MNKIDTLLSGYRLDRSKLEDMRHILKHAIDHNEIKRFGVFLEYYKGRIEVIDEEIYRIFMPKQLSYSSMRSSDVGSFLSNVVISKNIPYFALGNGMVMTMLNHALKPSISILKDYHKGLLFLFNANRNVGKY